MKRILLVIVKTLGDTLYINNLAKQIKTVYPGSHLTVYINDMYLDIIKDNPQIDNILSKPEWFKEWETIHKDIISDKFDEVMIPQQLCGEDNMWHHIDKYRYNHLLNFYMVRCRLPKVDISKEKLFMYIADNVKEFNYKNYIVFQSGSGNIKTKNWDNVNFMLLFDRLKGIKFIHIGLKDDPDIPRGNIIDLREELSFQEIYKLCKDAKCFIGADSGPTHIAASSGCPTIQLCGMSIPQTSGAFGDNVVHIVSTCDERCINQRCHFGTCKYNKPCINNIKVEDVYEEVKKYI